MTILVSHTFTPVGSAATEASPVSSKPKTETTRTVCLRVMMVLLFRKPRDYGLRGLEVRHGGFSKMIMADPKAAAAKAGKDDIELLYWTGLSWMAAISIGKDDPELVSDVPQAESLIYRAYDLNPDFDEGGLHDFLITYEGGKPAMMGG